MTIEQDPFGQAYRSGRLSDEETAQRMLQTAVDKVNQEGLRVSFDLLRFEDIIADAGVARSAAYRRWPTKNHFYADLLRELAGHLHPAIAAYDENTVNIVRDRALEHLEHLRTPEGRRLLLVELCREGALQNFSKLVGSTAWSVYVTLTITLVSLPDTQLKTDLKQALAHSEEHFLEKMATFYATMIDVLGFQLLPELPGVDLNVVAQLGAAVVEGLAMNAASLPDVKQCRFKGDPFGAGHEAEWSLPALGFTSIIMAMIRPNPARQGTWSDAQLDECRQRLEALNVMDTPDE